MNADDTLWVSRTVTAPHLVNKIAWRGFQHERRALKLPSQCLDFGHGMKPGIKADVDLAPVAQPGQAQGTRAVHVALTVAPGDGDEVARVDHH